MENTIERAYIMADKDMLGEKELSWIFDQLITNPEDGISVPDVGIMPLKEAKLALEKQLVSKAYEQYHSTYKVAEVLKVDQSTVVKLLQKHKCKDIK
jgi:Response regulator containing CheY-like receiver, AAA-type ATPase, and DNA-binding domains